jgi:hypothetical protein
LSSPLRSAYNASPVLSLVVSDINVRRHRVNSAKLACNRAPMSFSFDFDDKNKIIRCRISGVVTDQSLRDYYQACAKHGAERPTYSGIFDMSGVTALNITSETVRQVAQSPPAIPDSNIPRIIIAGTTYMYGMARMFDVQGAETRPNLHVVRNEKEAFALLGVISPHFETA